MTHQQRSKIGVSKTERAVVKGALGYLGRREVGHGNRDLQHDRPESDGVFVSIDIENTGLVVVELDQVDRGQVASRVIEKQILTTRVGSPNSPSGRAGVPLVDGGVELETRVGTCPGGLGDPAPHVAGFDGPADGPIGPVDQIPVVVVLDCLDEVVGDTD